MQKPTLSKVADTVLSKPLTLEVDIIYHSKLKKKLQDWKVLPKKRVFEVHPITLGSLIRISKLLLSIEIKLEQLSKENWQETSYKAMRDHSKTIAEVVAVAITNNVQEPKKSLIDFILYNFTAKELMAVLSVVIGQMNITDFMSSIVSVRALNALEQKGASVKVAETSPAGQGEIIAPGN
jgi:hypothetical protein